MLKVLIWDYHHDYNQKRYWKEFSDFNHLQAWLFNSMNVCHDGYEKYGSDTKYYYMDFRMPTQSLPSGTIIINPNGRPANGSLKIEQIENEKGILFEAGKYCSNRVNIFIQSCLQRRDKKKEYVDEAI